MHIYNVELQYVEFKYFALNVKFEPKSMNNNSKYPYTLVFS